MREGGAWGHTNKANSPSDRRDATNLTESGVGNWHEKNYHTKPSTPNEASPQIHTEFFIHEDDLALAMTELWKHRDQFNKVLMISEFRQIAVNNIPRSPHNVKYHTHGDRKAPTKVHAFHFTWYNDRAGVQKATEQLREILR